MPPVKQARSQTYYYKFSVDGGAVGTIPLRGPKLPNGAVVTDALLVVDTPLGSGGAATAALQAQAAADIQAAVAFNAAPFATAGAKRASALTAVAPPVSVSGGAKQPSMVVGSAALNAGAFRLVLEYRTA